MTTPAGSTKLLAASSSLPGRKRKAEQRAILCSQPTHPTKLTCQMAKTQQRELQHVLLGCCSTLTPTACQHTTQRAAIAAQPASGPSQPLTPALNPSSGPAAAAGHAAAVAAASCWVSVTGGLQQCCCQLQVWLVLSGLLGRRVCCGCWVAGSTCRVCCRG